MKNRGGILTLLGPGILVAATGVGAGDLAAATLAGNHLGVSVLWAALLGSFLKFVLNEGLARWQLVTGRTLLEGCMDHLGRPFQLAFILYLIPWSFFVGSALMSACGVVAHAVVPVFQDGDQAVLVFGALHSLLGLALARLGGYALFEKTMSVCIGVMFLSVVGTAYVLNPDWSGALSGLFIPRLPDAGGDGLIWTISLMGGVGGTLTMICYGYWIREKGRRGAAYLRISRLDLGVAYAMTAVFGVAMVIIGSQIEVSGRGTGLMVALAEHLKTSLGPAGGWLFLAGAWGAVFSSLLGVWQSVPFVFADFVGQLKKDSPEKLAARLSENSATYRIYQWALAVLPVLALSFSFREIQKIFAFVGAFFMPFLAFVLLYLNARSRWLGEHKNRPVTSLILILILLFFAYFSWLEVQNRVSG